MLAQAFMPAEALGITDKQRDALIKVLGMLERGEIKEDQFYMAQWCPGWCGSPCCIGGWCDTVYQGDAQPMSFYESFRDDFSALISIPPGLNQLLFPSGDLDAIQCDDPRRGAMALRSYLTTADSQWDEAMAAEMD